MDPQTIALKIEQISRALDSLAALPPQLYDAEGYPLPVAPSYRPADATFTPPSPSAATTPIPSQSPLYAPRSSPASSSPTTPAGSTVKACFDAVGKKAFLVRPLGWLE